MGNESTPATAAAPATSVNTARRQLPHSWFAAVVIAVLVGCLGVYIASFFEPEYHGKPLSYWIDHYNIFGDPAERVEAADAIHHIGTNALPFAVRWLSASDSRFQLWLKERLEKQSLVKFTFHEAYVFHERADTVFDLLGPEAASAVPSLEKLMDQPDTAERAVPILCGLGQDSLPALERGLTNRDAKVRVITAGGILNHRAWVHHPWAIPYYDNSLPAVFPNDLLLRLLKDQEADVRQFAARAIGESALFRNISPEQGVPALIRALRDPMVENRNADVIALGGFGPSASNAVPILLNILQTNRDLQIDSCGAILDALGAIRVEKSSIVTALTKQLAGSNNDGTRIWAIETLSYFGPLAKPAIPLLLKCLAEKYPMAAAALKTLDYAKADHTPIISALRKRLESEDLATRIWAASELGRLGPEATSAVPSLIEAATPPDHGLRAAVYRALQKIDPVAANINARALEVTPPTPDILGLLTNAWALKITPPEPVPLGLLIKSLADKNPDIRCAAADCLGQFGPEGSLAIPALHAALADENKYVREAAQIALESINPANATNIVSK